MQQVPGFKPRKCGMSVSRLELTQARGGCSGKAEGQGNCGPPGGSRPCGSPGGGCGRFPCLAGSAFRDEGHRERFQIQWKAQADVPDRDAMCAALYLLTADGMLWGMAAKAVRPELIDFASVCIRGIGLDGYVLFHSAKDLYKGTNRLSLSELTDPELVSDGTFWTVITAFLIRRYGAEALEEERSSGC